MNRHLNFCLIACSLFANPAQGALVFGVSSLRDLVTFDSGAPGSILTTTPITGVSGSIQGIDFRPATGQLYALENTSGSTYRIHTVNTSTGVATQIGTDLTLNGTFVGFDFNPSVDRIRVVTNADSNYRLHPDTGVLVSTDISLQYDVGDVNFGANPNATGSAYNNNIAGSPTTILFNIDTTLDVLTTQVPPNNGTLNTVGALGANFSDRTGFDISPAGSAFASTTNALDTSTSFYQINLGTGSATLIGTVGNSLILNDIAIPEPSTLGMLAVAAALLARRGRKPF